MGNWEQFSEDFRAFLDANQTWIIVIAALVLVAGALMLILRRRHTTQSAWTVREISAAALCLALAFLLSFIKLFSMPQAGSVTPASMLPIMLFAYIYGTPKGLIVGLAYALLQCLQDFWVVHWAQFFLDYILAFTVLAVAGLFRRSIYPGMVLACLLRYVCHVIAGVIFFAEYAGDQPVLAYSLGYNSFVLIELAICIVLTVLMHRTIENLKKRASEKPVTAG